MDSGSGPLRFKSWHLHLPVVMCSQVLNHAVSCFLICKMKMIVYPTSELLQAINKLTSVKWLDMCMKHNVLYCYYFNNLNQWCEHVSMLGTLPSTSLVLARFRSSLVYLLCAHSSLMSPFYSFFFCEPFMSGLYCPYSITAMFPLVLSISGRNFCTQICQPFTPHQNCLVSLPWGPMK